MYVYLLDARRGAPRASHLARRPVAQTFRRSEVPKFRCTEILALRPKTPELKPETAELKPDTPELTPVGPRPQKLKPRHPRAQARDFRAKAPWSKPPERQPKTPELKPETPELKPETSELKPARFKSQSFGDLRAKAVKDIRIPRASGLVVQTAAK